MRTVLNRVTLEKFWYCTPFFLKKNIITCYQYTTLSSKTAPGHTLPYKQSQPPRSWLIIIYQVNHLEMYQFKELRIHII